jgi:hypothetical protein
MDDNLYKVIVRYGPEGEWHIPSGRKYRNPLTQEEAIDQAEKFRAHGHYDALIEYWTDEDYGFGWGYYE